MKIGIVWQSEYPWDVRIDKMVRSLVKNGHEVSVLATNKEGKSLKDEYLNAKVYRLPFSNNKILRKLINIPIFLNPYYISATKNMIIQEDLDILVVRDLPLLLAGWYSIKSTNKNIKLVFDMAEDYPATFKVMENKSFLDKLVLKNHFFARILEKKSVNVSDMIITVVEESADRVSKINPAKKVIVISNTPDEEFYNEYLDESVLNEFSSTFNIVYEGNFGKKRGLETAIDSLVILKDRIENVRVVLVGGKEDEIEYIKQYAEKKGVSNYLICTGRIPYKQLARYVNVADVGMVPHLKCEHTETTIPNKLFDYMCLGKPVIVSDVTPLKRIVEETNSGVVFDWNDPLDFADKIINIIAKKEFYSQNSKKAFEDKYNWGYDEVVLINELNLISKTNK